MEKRIYTYVIKFNIINKRHDQFETLITKSFEKVNFWCLDFSDTQSRTLLTYNILLCWADKFFAGITLTHSWCSSSLKQLWGFDQLQK